MNEKQLGGDVPCTQCGTTRNPRWFTDNILWNEVTDEHLVHNERNDVNGGNILCLNCFAELSQEIYDVGAWRFIPEARLNEKKV